MTFFSSLFHLLRAQFSDAIQNISSTFSIWGKNPRLDGYCCFVLTILVMKLDAGRPVRSVFWERLLPQLDLHIGSSQSKKILIWLFIEHCFVFHFTVVENVVGSASRCQRSCSVSALHRAANEERVCSNDVTNKPSHEFRTGYWLEGSCLESNYIKGCCGNICLTEIAADDKQGPTRL